MSRFTRNYTDSSGIRRRIIYSASHLPRAKERESNFDKERKSHLWVPDISGFPLVRVHCSPSHFSPRQLSRSSISESRRRPFPSLLLHATPLPATPRSPLLTHTTKASDRTPLISPNPIEIERRRRRLQLTISPRHDDVELLPHA